MYKDNQERVDAYLRGEMNLAEKRKFESDIESDLHLKKDYIETKAISDALADRQRKLSQMAEWESEEKLKIKADRLNRILRRCTMWTSVAACAAICFFIIKSTLISTRSSDEFVMPNFAQVEQPEEYNSGIDVLDSLINSHDYNNALAFADLLIDENQHRLNRLSSNQIEVDNELEIYKYSKSDSLSSFEADERLIYEKRLYMIEWRRINLLLALGKLEEYKSDIYEFSRKDGIYKSQADSLLNSFNK